MRTGHGFVDNVTILNFCYPLDIRQDHTRINEIQSTGWCAALFGANNVVADDSGARANVAGSCIVAVDAAIGATTLVTSFTSRLGGGHRHHTAEQCRHVLVTGTVTNATDIAVTALATAITAGTQLWNALSAGATVAANARVKPRYGSAGAGGTAADVGRVVSAGTRWDDSPLIGSGAAADTGRTVILIPQRSVLSPSVDALGGVIIPTAKRLWTPAGRDLGELQSRRRDVGGAR